MNLPQLFLQQLDAAFSSPKILKTVSQINGESFGVAAPDLIAGELFPHQPCGFLLGGPDGVWVWFLAPCVSTSRTGKKHPLFLWKPLYLCGS